MTTSYDLIIKLLRNKKTAKMQNHSISGFEQFTKMIDPLKFWHIYFYHVFFFFSEIPKYVQAYSGTTFSPGELQIAPKIFETKSSFNVK